jgi:uncharacterized membrane protein
LNYLTEKLLLKFSDASAGGVAAFGVVAAFFSALAAVLFAAAALKQFFMRREVPDLNSPGMESLDMKGPIADKGPAADKGPIADALHRSDISLSTASSVAAAVILISLILLSYLKLHQYYTLETGAFDHGLESNVAWNTGHGNGFYGSLHDKNYLGSDHFSPIQVITGTLFYLWEDAAMLLLLQVAGIALSAAALYRLALSITGYRLLSLLFLPLFLFNPYLHMVNRFDYHPVALALPAYLWALYFLQAGRMPWFIVAVFVSFSTIEKAPLDIAGLAAFMCLKRDTRRAGAVLLLSSVALFFLEIKLIMPFYNDGKSMMHFYRYGNLGSGLGGIAVNLLKHPMVFLEQSFLNALKMESLFYLVTAFGFLPLLAGLPLMTVFAPIMGNLLSGYDGQWQFKFHYTATMTPFLLFASIHGAANLMRIMGRRYGGQRAGAAACYLVSAFAMLNLAASILLVPYPGGRRGESSDIDEFLRIKGGFDKRAAVCAQSPLVPHLAMRKYVYVIDIHGQQKKCKTAEYIVFDLFAGFWPFDTHEKYMAEVADVLRDKAFGVEHEAHGVIVLRKGHSRTQNARVLEYVEGLRRGP